MAAMSDNSTRRATITAAIADSPIIAAIADSTAPTFK
jgi:hypothetical protein